MGKLLFFLAVMTVKLRLGKTLKEENSCSTEHKMRNILPLLKTNMRKILKIFSTIIGQLKLRRRPQRIRGRSNSTSFVPYEA